MVQSVKEEAEGSTIDDAPEPCDVLAPVLRINPRLYCEGVKQGKLRRFREPHEIILAVEGEGDIGNVLDHNGRPCV